MVAHADGFGERRAAVAMFDALSAGSGRRSAGADKAYDTTDFVAACRERHITPHVACSDTRVGGSALGGRTTRHTGYRLSQIVRKRIEEHFGWSMTIGRMRQTVFRGLRRVDQQFTLTLTASSLTRLARTPITVRSGAVA